MSQTNSLGRQWSLKAMAATAIANIGSGNEVLIKLPVGALLTDLLAVVTTAFNSGATCTLTVSDGTTTFVSAVDVTSTGSKSVSNTPKYYPSGGTLTVSMAQTGTAATAGAAFVVPAYVVNNRTNEVAQA
jgi:hypothetical protein